jgi:hypothetical protein
MIAQAVASTPEASAEKETSRTKTYAGACGGRTMYSTGAMNSTEPRESSARSRASARTPCSSHAEK